MSKSNSLKQKWTFFVVLGDGHHVPYNSYQQQQFGYQMYNGTTYFAPPQQYGNTQPYNSSFYYNSGNYMAVPLDEVTLKEYVKNQM